MDSGQKILDEQRRLFLPKCPVWDGNSKGKGEEERKEGGRQSQAEERENGRGEGGREGLGEGEELSKEPGRGETIP